MNKNSLPSMTAALVAAVTVLAVRGEADGLGSADVANRGPVMSETASNKLAWLATQVDGCVETMNEIAEITKLRKKELLRESNTLPLDMIETLIQEVETKRWMLRNELAILQGSSLELQMAVLWKDPFAGDIVGYDEVREYVARLNGAVTNSKSISQDRSAAKTNRTAASGRGSAPIDGQSWLLNPIVAPSEMDWIVLKLEAQCRIPWGCQGFTYRLDYRKGNAFGEVEAQVTYLAPTNQDRCSEMSAAIIHALTDGESVLGGEFHSDSDLRSHLRMRTCVTRMAGRPLPLVDSMADSVVDLRPELGRPPERPEAPAAGPKIRP